MILTFAAPQIAVFALQFGPLETCALILMGLTCISSVSANNQFKGLAMGVLGLLLACVGMSPFSAESRFTFDIFALNSGIDLVAVIVGVFALSEVLDRVERMRREARVENGTSCRVQLPSLGEWRGRMSGLVKSSLIGTFVGELGMNLLAVLLAHAMGTENIVDIMMGTSGIIGVIIVVASTVKLNDINLYSSSLGLATMINALFNKAISRNGLVWALGIVGTLLSVIGIINYFTNFLTLLGVAIPPVAGIMVVDYFILKRSRATLDASRAKGELPEKVEKWNPIAIVCWIAGFAVGEVTSIMNAGIPGLNSLILAGVLYWIVMKVYASMKKVDTVTFTETDQVL